MSVDNPNLVILEHVAKRLDYLVDDVVFLGGCATGLLITDGAAPPIRMTKDVDMITELTTLADYHRFTNKLRQLGFAEDQSKDAPICRWGVEDVVLDIMPTNPAILGFGNRWYKPAIKNAIQITLPSGRLIKRVSAPHFIATKIEAFHGRGNNDYLMSHDLEDVIAVVDGRAELISDIQQSEDELRDYLAVEINQLLADVQFLDALPGYLPGDAASQARLTIVKERLLSLVQHSTTFHRNL